MLAGAAAASIGTGVDHGAGCGCGGAGRVGLSGSGLSVTLNASESIAGGSGANGRADAIDFTGRTGTHLLLPPTGVQTFGNGGAPGSGMLALAAGTMLGFSASGFQLANDVTLGGAPTFDVEAGTQAMTGDISDAPSGNAPGEIAKTGAGTLVPAEDTGIVALMAPHDRFPRVCHVLVIAAPQEIDRALRGSSGPLRRVRPVLIAAPVRDGQLADLRRLFERVDDSGFVSRADRDRADAALLVAAPNAANISFESFDPS